MRIATNVSALNAWRNLTFTNNSLSKTLEKLSSGYRINRAADDAAGLAISEKMRGQINGLNMAVKNAQDGISLIQTAEGALNEAHVILQRMRELAVQSANDTNTDIDRGEIQKEIDQLAEELTRIANTTEFNTKKLLDGTLNDVRFHIGANKDQSIDLSVASMRADDLGVAGNSGIGFEVTSAGAASNALTGDATYSVQALASPVDIDDSAGTPNNLSVNYALVDSDGKVAAVSEDGSTYWALTLATAVDELATATIASDTSSGTGFVFADPVISGTVTADTAGTALTGTATVEFTSDAATLASGTYAIVDDTHALVSSGYGLVDDQGQLVAVGDGTDWTNLAGEALFTSTTDLSSYSEVTVSSAGGIDVSAQGVANSAIETINDAIEMVSSERSKLGALQNRLDHTINNLSVAAENLSAAESRIRDVDMALEMANFTRNQILVQAGTAMLAQANAAPQSVLQLLG